jgi:hypothetical protein
MHLCSLSPVFTRFGHRTLLPGEAVRAATIWENLGQNMFETATESPNELSNNQSKRAFLLWKKNVSGSRTRMEGFIRIIQMPIYLISSRLINRGDGSDSLNALDLKQSLVS